VKSACCSSCLRAFLCSHIAHAKAPGNTSRRAGRATRRLSNAVAKKYPASCPGHLDDCRGPEHPSLCSSYRHFCGPGSNSPRQVESTVWRQFVHANVSLASVRDQLSHGSRDHMSERGSPANFSPAHVPRFGRSKGGPFRHLRREKCACSTCLRCELLAACANGYSVWAAFVLPPLLCMALSSSSSPRVQTKDKNSPRLLWAVICFGVSACIISTSVSLYNLLYPNRP
jgi:hypothetical protein